MNITWHLPQKKQKAAIEQIINKLAGKTENRINDVGNNLNDCVRLHVIR